MHASFVGQALLDAVVVVVLHRKHLRMILSSACALSRRRKSSSRDAPRSSLWRFASKAGQQSHRWSYDSSSLSHRRHMVSSGQLIRFFQRRSAGVVATAKAAAVGRFRLRQ